jgi:2'-hydroxyisoflavone reductase
MKLLILGGTRFLGRHILEAAQARGHEVTLFHRGSSLPEDLPPVERLIGDREQNLSALAGRQWDAVIDTSGYVPSVVGASAQLLRDAAPHYTFISTISVYADHATPNADESYALSTMPAEQVALVNSAAQVNGENYGALKALCEAEVAAAFPGAACIVRAGLIVGPHDPTDRFTYWVRRTARGGAMLVPDTLESPWQLVDARDLAAWTLSMSEQRADGLFNATGPAPEQPLLFGDVLRAAVETAGQQPEWVRVSAAFIEAEDIGGWPQLPLHISPGASEYAGFYRVNCARAIAAGLTFRPIASTVADTHAWDQARLRMGAGEELKMGLSASREAELLAKWRLRPRT